MDERSVCLRVKCPVKDISVNWLGGAFKRGPYSISFVHPQHHAQREKRGELSLSLSLTGLSLSLSLLELRQVGDRARDSHRSGGSSLGVRRSLESSRLEVRVSISRLGFLVNPLKSRFSWSLGVSTCV